MPLLRWIVTAVAVLALTLGLFWSIRLARADLLLRQDTPSAVAAAVRFVPLNARYYVREAFWAEQKNPDAPAVDADLERAAQLDPRLSAAWMNLGLREEMRGHKEQAERLLLQAAAIDHLFKPSWTLANFYFRSGQPDKFWPRVRTCFDLMGSQKKAPWTYDPEPLFDLCWRMTEDAGKILQLAVPAQSEIEIPYLRYLVKQDHLDAAATLARRAIPRATPDDLPVLWEHLQALLAQGRTPDAVEAWNLMAQRRLIPYQPLDPSRGLSLTNGSFAQRPTLKRVFDWELPDTTGVTAKHFDSPPMLRFDFNGDEAEHCQFLQQIVPVASGREYQLGFEYRTAGIPEATGLQWHAFDARSHAEVPVSGESLSAPDWTPSQVRFTTPAATRLIWLSLRYDRRPGTTRIKGSLSLRNVSLQFAGHAAAAVRLPPSLPGAAASAPKKLKSTAPTTGSRVG